MKFHYTPEYEAFKKLDNRLQLIKLVGFIAMVYTAIMLISMFFCWVFISDMVNWTRINVSFGIGACTFVAVIVITMKLTPKVDALKQPYLDGVSMFMDKRSDEIMEEVCRTSSTIEDAEEAIDKLVREDS